MGKLQGPAAAKEVSQPNSALLPTSPNIPAERALPGTTTLRSGGAACAAPWRVRFGRVSWGILLSKGEAVELVEWLIVGRRKTMQPVGICLERVRLGICPRPAVSPSKTIFLHSPTSHTSDKRMRWSVFEHSIRRAEWQHSTTKRTHPHPTASLQFPSISQLCVSQQGRSALTCSAESGCNQNPHRPELTFTTLKSISAPI